MGILSAVARERGSTRSPAWPRVGSLDPELLARHHLILSSREPEMAPSRVRVGVRRPGPGLQTTIHAAFVLGSGLAAIPLRLPLSDA